MQGPEVRRGAVDFFGARYYASSLGRFMTPDWSAAPTPVPYASFSDPQSLDLYAYTLDNPETNTDPDGHWCFIGIGTTCAPKKVKGGPKLAGPDWLTRCMGNLFCCAALDAGITPITLFSGAHGKKGSMLTAPPEGPQPMKLPDGKNGEPNEWVRVGGSPHARYGPRWKPRHEVPGPIGAQPGAFWDAKDGYWANEPGNGEPREHHDRWGNKLGTAATAVGAAGATGAIIKFMDALPPLPPVEP